jgi:hypothetical protein
LKLLQDLKFEVMCFCDVFHLNSHLNSISGDMFLSCRGRTWLGTGMKWRRAWKLRNGNGCWTIRSRQAPRHDMSWI